MGETQIHAVPTEGKSTDRTRRESSIVDLLKFVTVRVLFLFMASVIVGIGGYYVQDAIKRIEKVEAWKESVQADLTEMKNDIKWIKNTMERGR